MGEELGDIRTLAQSYEKILTDKFEELKKRPQQA